MPNAPSAPMALIRHFAVTDPRPITETAIANIWKVRRFDGSFAALKVYKNGDMQDESPGFTLLNAWNGSGAARLYAQTNGAVLLEWLDGPSLGDLVRDGRDNEATEILGRVATQLHLKPVTQSQTFGSLRDEFAPLIAAKCFDDCADVTRHIIQNAQRIATQLLATQSDIRPLHRDLHHDNIRGSARGYLAFDAKGVIGERSFELANAFRNPIGAEAIFSDPTVIKRRLATWSREFDVQPRRLRIGPQPTAPFRWHGHTTVYSAARRRQRSP
jgi:streptomycin 6-kinase